jgi:hypothetical protein
LTPRQRRWSVALTTGLFILSIGLILASVVNVRSLLGVEGSVFESNPAAVSSDLPVYLQGNPSWGSFTVDGRPVASLPQAEHDGPLILAPGQHRITWLVAPFQTQNCAVTVVDAFSITGSCFLNGVISTGHEASNSALVLLFSASLNDLPSDQRAALISQVQAVEDGYTISETVHPGELYAVTDPSLCVPVVHLALCYARANQPLQATLRLQLDTNNSPDDPCVGAGACSANGQDCRSFCTDPMLNQADQLVTPTGWEVAVIVQLLWSYTIPSGQVIARNQPVSALRGTLSYETISLHIDRRGQGWLVVPASSETDSGANDPFCNRGAEDVMALLNASGNSQEVYVQQSFHAAADCLEIAAPPVREVGTTPTPTPATNAPQKAVFLVRFGVVLAVNEAAQHLLPFLPVADAYERSLAQSLLAALPSAS